MADYTTITYGGETLNVLSCVPNKVQKTRKNVVGKTIVETNIIGTNVQQWIINISGILTGASIGTLRASLEALDDADSHAYVDGIHDGDYYIRTGSLTFEDDGNLGGTYYKYNMTLVEV